MRNKAFPELPCPGSDSVQVIDREGLVWCPYCGRDFRVADPMEDTRELLSQFSEIEDCGTRDVEILDQSTGKLPYHRQTR